MINLLRAEWIKLRTVRMNWVLGNIAVVFPLVVTLLTAYFRGDDTGFNGLNTQDLVSTLTGTTVVCSLLCGVIAAAAITSEFGFGTIRPTFAATPRRLRVLVAKGVVTLLTTTAIGATVIAIGWFGGSAIARSRGASIELSTVDTAVPAMIGAIVLVAVMSLAGYGLGLLMRSTPAAVATLIVWPLIAEGLIGGLLGLITGKRNLNSWMPFQAGLRLVFVDRFAEGPSRLAGGALFAGVALLLVALGSVAVSRRDA